MVKTNSKIMSRSGERSRVNEEHVRRSSSKSFLSICLFFCLSLFSLLSNVRFRSVGFAFVPVCAPLLSKLCCCAYKYAFIFLFSQLCPTAWRTVQERSAVTTGGVTSWSFTLLSAKDPTSFTDTMDSTLVHPKVCCMVSRGGDTCSKK